jgi:hypothetical protein
VHSHRRVAQGFEELDEDDGVIPLVEYKIDGMGSKQDAARRHAVEDLLNNALGWTGSARKEKGRR